MKILSYDSKLIQTFRALSDFFGINLLFLLCCIPVITIGSARVAMYTALRASQRNEPWVALFWKTFVTSLKQPTILWCICVALLMVFGMNTYNSYNLGHKPMAVISGICLGIIMCVTSLSPMFFSRFDCTIKEMAFNSVRMLIAFPIRVILGTALSWAPVLFLFFGLQWIIAKWLPIFILLYFAAAGAFFNWMMRKPFGRITGEEQEQEDPYLIREAKKNLEKLEAELIRQNTANMEAQKAKEAQEAESEETGETSK